MSEGPNFFMRSGSADTPANPKRWMLYDYNDGAAPLTDAKRGNAVGAQAVTEVPWIVRSDAGSWDRFYLGNNRSTFNPVNGLDNGLQTRVGGAWWWGGVAEASTAFEANGRTYLLFSRNGWDSAAYQIVSRTSEPGGILPSLALGGRHITNATEKILIRSHSYTNVAGGTNCENIFTTASFGTPDAFAQPYWFGPDSEISSIGFAAKMDYSPRRTTFFKELHFEASDASLSTLEQPVGVGTHSQPWRSINEFLVRQCRGGCGADVNLDGVVDLNDYFDFMQSQSNPHGRMGDINGNLLGPSEDIADFFDFWTYYELGC